MTQAVDSYAQMRLLADRPGTLNLAWTLDERGCLAADVDAVIAGVFAAELSAGLAATNTYMVKDPFAEELLGPAVARFFSLPEAGWSVTCGAGVISLLHGLARLALGSTALVRGETYPDFPHWVDACGGACVTRPRRELHRDIAVVFLERPSLVGDLLADPDDVRPLCEAAAAGGALVVIDESNANYWPPRFSAAKLATELDNLVVVRGFSKAYGLGGLRLGYCVASSEATARVRRVVAPLLAGSLALRAGAAVLDLGDIAGPLRDRIREGKPLLRSALDRLDLPGALESSEFLPYLLLDGDPQPIRARLEHAGLLGKSHVVWSGGVRTLHRLSAPLASARVERLIRQTGGGPPAR